jgi:ribosomal subunit interface protein
MQTDIKATNMKLTDAIRSFVEEKMNSLDAKTRRFGTVVLAKVEVAKTTKHHKKGDLFRAEIHVELPGKLVYSSCEHDDLYSAFTDTLKEAERQITDYKDKFESRKKGR